MGGLEKHCRKQRKVWAAADELIYLFFLPVLFLSQLKASNAVFSEETKGPLVFESSQTPTTASEVTVTKLALANKQIAK